MESVCRCAVGQGVAALLVLFPSVLGLSAVGASPPRTPSLDQHARSWHVRLPRTQMLAAWKRLKGLEVPGIPVDMRFDINGDVFYVSPSGDDEADGSEQNPWRTLAHAAEHLRPNTVIYLRAGTYYGPVRLDTKATQEAPAAIRAFEGETAYVTYANEFVAARQAEVHTAPEQGRERALDAQGKPLHYPPLVDVRGTWVEISGLHLIGVRDVLPHNLYSENGISFSGRGGEGCRVLYNEIEAVGHCGVKEMGHGGHSILIEGNYIHDIGQTFHDHCIYAPADDVTIRKNLLLNATGYGLHAYSSPRRIVATHNILAGNDQYGMVQGGPDALIAHNVFGSNKRGGLFFFRAGCTNAVVKNSIFFDDPAVDFDQMGDKKVAPSGNLLDYNCVVPGIKLGKMSPHDSIGQHNFQADPMVINARLFDFRLRRRSPCVDAGSDIGRPFKGTAPDVGLYELGW